MTILQAILAAVILVMSPLPALAAGPALPGDIVDASGAIVPSAYDAIAGQMSREAGIAYRFGAPANATAKGLPTLYQRPDMVSRDGATRWQVGGPRNPGDRTNDQAAAGSYSTNQANVLFLPDDPAERIGVADIQISGYEYNTFAQRPQLSWTRTSEPGGGIDSINAMDYRAQGLIAGGPVAVGRCGGRPGFCASSLVAFQNGLIATAGTNTASNRATVRLAANKVPTAIAMTGSSEFAFVAVWDTRTHKGQVAVIALAGLCDDCNPYDRQKPRAWYDWWHEWMGVYPGLPNMGNIAFMKVLGYIDLPGIAAPTDIAVTTGLDPFHTMLGNGNFMGLETPLADPFKRGSFRSGGDNAGRVARGGIAVVVSKSERKAAFIDLRPLLASMRRTYFEGTQGEFDATVGRFGLRDDQWPYAFAYWPHHAPELVKTVSLGARPTAVRTTQFGEVQRAWIGTEDGTLRIFGLGGYAGGPESRAVPSADGIVQLGTVAIGRNPTSLAISKSAPDDDSVDPLNRQVLVASRGERKIQWVRFAPDGNSGRVVRTLQDSRIVDPVAVEDADNFATAGHVLSIADYAGKAVLNYRYGKVVFADRGAAWACQPPRGCGMGATGDAPFEFGGNMVMPGRPFAISTANVP